MTTFFQFLKKNKFPNRAVRASFFEFPLTPSKLLFYTLGLSLLITLYILILTLNNKILVTIPARGGTITEGILGAPHALNPLITQTETDRALNTLIYAGLMKEDYAGMLVTDLAESYSVSPDGKVYTFKLRDSLVFSDKSPLTVGDVSFTLNKLKETTVGNEQAYWQNISVETPSPKTIVLTLASPDTTFLRRMTIGIVKSAMFTGVSAEAMNDPSMTFSGIGAGPFRLKNISYTNDAPKELVFARNQHYNSEKSLLDTIRIVSYSNQDELLTAAKNDDINITSALEPTALTETSTLKTVRTQTVATDARIALFRLQNESILQNSSFVRILDQYIDKDAIIATVENGYGVKNTSHAETSVSQEQTLAALHTIGYERKNGTLTKNNTTVTLRVAVENDERVLAAGRILATELGSLGITVDIRAFDQGTFQDDVIAGFYPFVLIATDETTLPTGYVPVTTLYSKGIIYVTDNTIHGAVPDYIVSQTLRYARSTGWYTHTDRIWKWFIRKE